MTSKPVSNETLLQQLSWRYATKAFDPNKKISTDDWATLEKSHVLTPTSYGIQPIRFVIITDQATREQLQRLGYRYVQGNPDLRVNILLTVEPRQEIHSTPASVGRFAYRGWVPYAVETVHYREGTLAIDLVDVKRNSMVWRGIAGDRISRGDIRNSGATIDAVVRGLFAAFPRRAEA